MTKATIEELDERVSALERAVSVLAQKSPSSKRGWRATVGRFAGDDVMKEIFELGRQIREAESRDGNK